MCFRECWENYQKKSDAHSGAWQGHALFSIYCNNSKTVWYFHLILFSVIRCASGMLENYPKKIRCSQCGRGRATPCPHNISTKRSFTSVGRVPLLVIIILLAVANKIIGSIITCGRRPIVAWLYVYLWPNHLKPLVYTWSTSCTIFLKGLN